MAARRLSGRATGPARPGAPAVSAAGAGDHAPAGAVAVACPPGRSVSTLAVFSRKPSGPAAKDVRSPARHAAGAGSATSGPLYPGRCALDRPLAPGTACPAHGQDPDGFFLRPFDVPTHLSAGLESAVLSHAGDAPSVIASAE